MISTQRPRDASGPTSNASLVAGLLVCATLGCLTLFKDLPVAMGAYVCGWGGLVAIAVALWMKYRGRWALNFELAFLGGVALQYLLAPTLLRLFTNGLEDFTAMDHEVSAERAEVHNGHPGAMRIVLLFVGVYLIISHLIRNGRMPRHSDGTLITTFPRGSLWLVGGLALLLWGTRFVLLKTGSYYHLDRSDFQFEDWRYSILAQIDAMLGPLVIAYYYSRGLLSKGASWLPVLAIVSMDFTWYFVSGSRERALMVLICLGVTHLIARGRISLKATLPIGLGVLLLITFMDFYRYAVREGGEASQISVSRVVDALQTAQGQSESAGTQQSVIAALGRLNDLDSVAAIYWWVPDVVPYLGGETYWNALLSVVPRFIWTDKPQMIMPINTWFFVNEGGSSPTTTMGEGYLNFGWPGVVLAACFCAFVIARTERFFAMHAHNGMFLPIYVSFLLTISRLHTQPVAVWIGTICKYFLLLSLACALSNLLGSTKTRRARPREEAPLPEPCPAPS